MTYHVLPFAVASFLADITEQRAGRPAGPTNVTVLAYDGAADQMRSNGYAITDQQHWGEMVNGAVTLFGQGRTDLVVILYPAGATEDGRGVDYGVILEGGRKPSFIEWTWAPRFGIKFAPDAVQEKLADGEGVRTIQMLLDREATSRPRETVVKGRLAGGGSASPFLGAGYGGGPAA